MRDKDQEARVEASRFGGLVELIPLRFGHGAWPRWCGGGERAEAAQVNTESWFCALFIIIVSATT